MKQLEISSIEEIWSILTNWAYNMKKYNGTDYKKTVIKVLWNSIVKQLVGKYFKDYNITFQTFNDVKFTRAEQAQDAKKENFKPM